MIKDLIKTRFKKSLKTYNDNAVAQKQMAEKLTDYIQSYKFSSVLELGCGTGFVTSELFKKYNILKYDAVDIITECESRIKPISNIINFICDDIETYSPNQKYDLIISNAALQWLENLPEYLNKMYNYLNKNGIFAFTIFGENHYNELTPFIKNTLKYYTISEIESLTKNYDIKHIDEEKITLNFKTPKEVLYHMKNTGVNAINSPHWTKSDLITFETEYCKNENNIKLTYNPIYVILEKNN